MASSPPAPLPDTDKLAMLRKLDQFREWRSLDDKRYCLVCGKIISGRQIHVTTTRGGSLRLICPTAQCDSIPMDWALPTDETLTAAETITPNECNVPPPRGESGVEPGPVSQLRKLAAHLKQAFCA